MLAIKAHFDGKTIRLPKEVQKVAPGEVVVIFENSASGEGERASWLKAQETAFARVWDNDEDAIYDTL
ncbi:MAG: hypothetical protein L0Y71_17825 [Gemmataceae bacterium]|nr:hypothetical protein [Gemmataceae bacterium]